ncbi:YceI family protein [Pontibacter vulgaris]|uniref:YceI family protein n=1 Tax=Pontibacter vulgaris TaxID=2905679 RepID=UPI001FA6E31B|nr:YceI family protein [Pontibacter vulgaris]
MKSLFNWVVFGIISILIATYALPLANGQSDWSSKPEKSTINYILKHPLHTVRGTSSRIKSKVSINDTKGIQAVTTTVPVKSFDSGNRTRDKDMLKVTEAATYPEVKFTSTSITDHNTHLVVKGQLQFHGITQDITFQAKQQLVNNEILVTGSFPISLENYKIKRPSIFGMAVKDIVTIEFHIVYTAPKTTP